MPEFITMFAGIARWFAKRNIATDGLTIILNFADADEALRFDAALRTDLKDVPPLGNRDIRESKIAGIAVRIESPVHTP